MIVYPENWAKIGQPIQVGDIEEAILEVVSSIECSCLALSGGLDSSLLLWFLRKANRKVRAFTIGNPESHPDIYYAKLVAASYPSTEHLVYVPTVEEIENERQSDDQPGDAAVRLFFRSVGQHTDSIMVGDGIDEFTCGYYGHQASPGEESYYDYLRRLQDEHLVPLHSNSGSVKVFLPYLDSRLLLLLSQIPISQKANEEHRKLPMLQVAKGKIPSAILSRWKYGFCDALDTKEER